MTEKRLNKEYGIDTDVPIRVKIGTVNRNDPTVVYITGKTWVSDNGSDEGSKNRVRTAVKNHIRRMISSTGVFEPKYIFDFDFNDSDITDGKKKFCSFEIFLRQNSDNASRDLKAIKDAMAGPVAEMARGVSESFVMNRYRLSERKNG